MSGYFLKEQEQTPEYDDPINTIEQKIPCFVQITNKIKINDLDYGWKIHNFTRYVESLIEHAEKKGYKNIGVKFDITSPFEAIQKMTEVEDINDRDFQEIQFGFNPCFFLVGERQENDIEFLERQKEIHEQEAKRISNEILKIKERLYVDKKHDQTPELREES